MDHLRHRDSPDIGGRILGTCGRAQACPPEDVGGPGGYEEFLEAMSHPGLERHDELLQWVGGSFDPEAFDVDEANSALDQVRERR